MRTKDAGLTTGASAGRDESNKRFVDAQESSATLSGIGAQLKRQDVGKTALHLPMQYHRPAQPRPHQNAFEEEGNMTPLSKRTIMLTMGLVVLAAVVAAVYWFRYSKPETVVHRDLVSTWADTIPVIDGSAADRQWADAEPLRGENLTVRSVHNDDRIAFLFEWNDPTLSLGTAGAWQLTEDGWRENRTVTKWESFVGKRHPEWLGLYWNINSPDFARQGCTATCHEGTGKHHTTPAPGEHVDTWHILSKHGWGAEF
ncbi:MAG: hypothetical protein CVT60_07430, partial [Actinobacteria bacterium HGW-Actinobacteria-10]